MTREASATGRIIAKLENDARNQLHSVMGMLELIAQAPLSAVQFEHLRACKFSADRLLRSVQNVCSFLEPETDKLQIRNFDLHQTLKALASVLDAPASRKGLTLSCDIQPPVPMQLSGDRDRLEDILARLIDNAIRFTDQGSVQLSAALDVEDAAGYRIRFDVRDTGRGFPSAILNRFSNHSLAEDSVQGLGLLIVQKLVRSMKGELTLGRNSEGGSRVTVTLPFQKAGRDQVLVQVASKAAPPLNILVAEDSDDSYYVLETLLQQRRHRLTRAVNGSRAVDLFKSGVFDLVLMDIHMPDMDGYSATRAIRVWETGRQRPRVPVIVLSSDSPSTQLREGAKAGCSAYLTKPVSSEGLFAVLDRYGALE